MEAVLKDHWYFLVLAFSLPLLKESEQVKASGSSVRLQDGMVLDCLCPWVGQLSMVSWVKKPNKQPLAIYHPKYGANFAELYEGRVQFLKASPMDGSISMSNVSDEDVGLYSCSLQAFPQGSWTKDTLVEKQGQRPRCCSVSFPPDLSTSFGIHPDRELVVLENDNLTLRCPPLHNDAVNEVTVEKLKGTEGGGVAGEVLAVCRVLQGAIESQEFTNRGKVECSDHLNVSLHLLHVSQQDGGVYRCNFSTDAGSHTTTVLLRIHPTQGSSDLWRRIYFFTGGAAVVLVLVLMSVALIFRRLCRRRTREEYRIQLHPAKSRQTTHKHEQGTVYDKMAKSGRQQRNLSPIYANVRTVRAHDKRKR
ncbi:CD226 antigen isoform X2 [Brachyhypopomus gauderio]|uniref:CD226 antigen isoform X2 n=1 Tax=Brachyhypopomus gauderio TaxID=698409 RepID=UPI004042C37E